MLASLRKNPGSIEEITHALTQIGPAAASLALPEVEPWLLEGSAEDSLTADGKQLMLCRIAPDKYPVAHLAKHLVEQARANLSVYRDDPETRSFSDTVIGLLKRTEMLGELGPAAV